MTIKITWMVDSGGVESVHRNGPNLTMRESYLGAILVTTHEPGWCVYTGGELGGEPEEVLGPFHSYTRARIALLLAAEKKVG